MRSNPLLRNKVILVISPQAWGKMMLAKHHYALELAKAGNIVYFLNPPDNYHWNLKSAARRIQVRVSSENDNLYIIEHKLYFTYKVKFHARFIYDLLIRRQIRNIISIIARPVNIVWSFDIGNLLPLSYFGEGVYKIFHPVDEPNEEQAIRAAYGANVIFSVTKEILARYSDYRIPSYFINHGLADEFITGKTENHSEHTNVRVGISGNLLRRDLDRLILLKLVNENSSVEFHFFGSYQFDENNNTGVTDTESRKFIESLKTFPNARLHGVLKSDELSQALNRMDAFLICYNIHKDQSKGTNYHKIMEYLSTGKVIIANNITTYEGEPDLIRMVAGRKDNNGLPALFKETIQEIDRYNTPVLQRARIEYAILNSYKNQLGKIEKIIGKDLF